VKLSPSEALKRNFEGIAEDDKLEAYLGDELLYSSAENYISDRPHIAPTDALDDLYILAREHENRRSYGKAMDAYLELLEKQPLHLEATERVAELYARRGKYDQALQYARKVLENDAYLPGGNFVYGWIQKEMGNFTDARDGLRWAVRSLEYRSASLQLLSEINLMEGKPELAFEQAGQSLSYNDMNLNSYKVRAIAQRILQNPAGAVEELDRILEINPLDHFALFEKYLLKPSSTRLNEFNNSFKSEMTRDEYLETALYYGGLGMQAEAVKILEQAPDYPVNDYWLAWFHREDQEISRGYLEKALAASPKYVFPYRTETLAVLEWASKQNPSWITDYYSALILWNVERNEEALGLLTKWGDEPDFTPFYHSRAYLKGILSDGALDDMERALALDPGHWRIYRELANMHIKRGEYSSALTMVETGHEKFPESYILDLIYSKCLNLTGQYQESLDVLENTEVLPFEGEQSGHRVFTNNHLMLAYGHYKGGNYEAALSHIDQSEAYPENLGSGKPYDPDYRNQNILRKKIYDRIGETIKSRQASDAIQAYDQKFGKQRGGSIFD
jgi:tetratricopeptide (TPR) repeat protein